MDLDLGFFHGHTACACISFAEGGYPAEKGSVLTSSSPKPLKKRQCKPNFKYSPAWHCHTYVTDSANLETASGGDLLRRLLELNTWFCYVLLVRQIYFLARIGNFSSPTMLEDHCSKRLVPSRGAERCAAQYGRSSSFHLAWLM